MKKLFKIMIFVCLIVPFNVFPNKENVSDINEVVEILEYDTLEEASTEYAEMLKIMLNEVINTLSEEDVNVEEYVNSLDDEEIKSKFNYIKESISDPIDVQIVSIRKNATFGTISYLVKILDEVDMYEYLTKNADKFMIYINEENDSNEINFEVDFSKYIDMQYEYIKNTPKKDFMNIPLEFYHVNGKWKILKKGN